MYRFLSLCLLGIAMTALNSFGPVSSVAWAQSSVTEEITVTARRKEESLQEVPLAVTAIGEQELQNRGITQIQQLVTLDPSVVLDEGFSSEDVRIAVRGLSNSRGRSNVAFLVDGVDVTSESVASPGASLLVNQRLLGDVERVEIIKGPQSALYGRAAFAGAISYVTRNANLDGVDGNFGVEINDNNLFQLSGGISGPLIDGVLGARVQAVTWDEDSFYDNEATGKNLGGSDGYATALTINWAPSDTFDAKWRISYSDSDTAVPPQVPYADEDLVRVRVPLNAWDVAGGPIETCVDPMTNVRDECNPIFLPEKLGSADGKKVRVSEDARDGKDPDGSSTEILRTSLLLNWDIGPGTFTSITGATDADLFLVQDIDFQAEGRPDTIANGWTFDSKNRTTQISQEFRYATDFDAPVNFTGGVLGWRERRDAEYRGSIAVCGPFVAGAPGETEPCASGGWQALVRLYNPQYGDNGFTDAETRHWSVYGLAEWDVTDRLTLSAEARYVDEVFNLKQQFGTPCQLSPFQGCAPIEEDDQFDDSVRTDYITPKVLAEYQFTDATLFYASVSKGQKPGGITTINSGAIVPPEFLKFDSEKLWAYEGGWKTSFDGDWGRLVLNGAVFFQDYTDKQVSIIQQATFRNPVPPPEFTTTTVASVENASDAEVFGQEIQAVWDTPLEGLSFNVAYTHLDTEYGDYKANTRSATTISQVGNCRQVTLTSATGERVFCEVDYGGNELEKSPEHTLSSTTSYIRPLWSTGFDGLVEVDANYTSDRYKDDNNFTEIESAWIINLRLGVQDDQWSVIGYVDNAFDDDTITAGGTIAPDFGAGFAIPPTLQVSSPLPRPRVVGLRANYRFGE
jgi:outer membrane receptor protein involved in Fe transport